MEVTDVDDVVRGLAGQGYLVDEGLATAVLLALRLQRPLLLEGDAGVGKTEVARALAAWTGGPLVRLQCHDGLDASQALYEWDHARQLLHLRAAEATGEATDRGTAALEGDLFDERFLVRRPLLAALDGRPGDPPPVLLVDEVDRADDEFEALLLELLSDWAVTIPELGTIRAEVPPLAVLTSNRTRDVHDALKRRCLYHWVEQPTLEREVAIVELRAPEVAPRLAAPRRRGRRRDPLARAVQAAGGRRDHRLGPRRRRARPRRARRGRGRGHPRHRGEVPRGRGPGAGPRGRPDRRRRGGPRWLSRSRSPSPAPSGRRASRCRSTPPSPSPVRSPTSTGPGAPAPTGPGGPRS